MEPGLHTLRKQRWKHAPSATRRSEPQNDAVERGERILVCARCDRAISDEGARIERSGLFEHSQVNPHGYIWHFGCFSRAPGAVPVGGRESHFSWFPGMTWRLLHCGGCSLHLGWLFEDSGGDDHFFALILDRLAERERR